jgi:hypothetical protein
MAITRATGRRTVWAAPALLVALLVGGCGRAPSPAASSVATTGAVSAILDSLRTAGISCGEPSIGVPENEPQWNCQGTLRGVRINLDFVADGAGVMDMEVEVPAATGAITAKSVFDDLTATTPMFATAMPAIRQWIESWSGSSGVVTHEMPGARAGIDSDATWITLALTRVPYFGSPKPGSSV